MLIKIDKLFFHTLLNILFVHIQHQQLNTSKNSFLIFYFLLIFELKNLLTLILFLSCFQYFRILMPELIVINIIEDPNHKYIFNI